MPQYESFELSTGKVAYLSRNGKTFPLKLGQTLLLQVGFGEDVLSENLTKKEKREIFKLAEKIAEKKTLRDKKGRPMYLILSNNARTSKKRAFHIHILLLNEQTEGADDFMEEWIDKFEGERSGFSLFIDSILWTFSILFSLVIMFILTSGILIAIYHFMRLMLWVVNTIF